MNALAQALQNGDVIGYRGAAHIVDTGGSGALDLHAAGLAHQLQCAQSKK